MQATYHNVVGDEFGQRGDADVLCSDNNNQQKQGGIMVTNKAPTEEKHYQPHDHETLTKLRQLRPAHKKLEIQKTLTVGQRVADKVASTMGSWRFIIIQSGFLLLWIGMNVLAWMNAWDPYPFILLNLMLSFQAAYAAPIIMMAQNRQSEIDRQKAAQDYDINLKAELEIEALHQKIDLLREQEIKMLIEMLQKRMAEK